MMNDGTVCNYYEFPYEFFEGNLEKKLVNSDFRNQCDSFLLTKNSLKNIEHKKKLIKLIYLPQMELMQEKILLKIEVVTIETAKNNLLSI